MPTFKLRTATPEDAQTLAHIGVATFVESYTTDLEGGAMMAHCTHEHAKTTYEKYLAARRTRCWLAEYAQTGAPVGYALNCMPDLPIETSEADIELKRIYILSKYHGHGIAQALLQASRDHARSLGATRLLLGTYEENHRAKAFYVKHGFEIIGTRKFDVGGKIYDDIIMAANIG